MKKLTHSLLAAALLLSAAPGCNVLDKEPLASVSPSNFYKNGDDAEAGLTAAYDALQAGGLYGLAINMVGETPSDNVNTNNGDIGDLDKLIWSAGTSQMRDVYRDSYVGINRANAVIKYVPGIAMNATRRNEILGEARFLRALHYFHLARTFGGAPLRLEPTESADPTTVNLPRATVDDVYKQVTDDLTAAEGLAPVIKGASDHTRATKGSVNALQARVYLTRRQWADASTAAAKVVANSTYALVTPFKAVYPADNKAESIFEIQFGGSLDGGNIIPDLVLPAPPATYSFAKFNLPTIELIRFADTLANPTDRRWKAIGPVLGGTDHASYLFGTRTTGDDAGPFVYKWPGPPNGFNSPDNTYVLRLADVLLMQAEALNEQNQGSAALAPLNRVRNRAGLPNYAGAQTQQALRTEIDRQRRLELAFEGERWYDLLRYARHTLADPAAQHTITALDMIQTVRGTRDVNYLLFPIPLYELNNNPNVKQNPGY